MQVPHWTIEDLLKVLLRIFLFVLPWQTILITQERFLNGVKWEYGTLGFYATEILLWITIFVFIGWVLQNKSFKFEILRQAQDKFLNFKFTKDRIFLFFVLLFVLYSFISITWAPNKDLALQHSLHILEAVMIFLMIFVGPLKFRQSGFWFVLGAFPVALLGISQFFLQTTWECKWLGLASHVPWQPGTSIVGSETIGRWLRAYGSFPHPNVFGGYMAMVFFWSLLLFEVRVFGKKQYRFLQYIFITIISVGLFVSFSRAALFIYIFILLISILFSFYMRKGFYRSGSFLYTVGLGICFILIFLPILQTRFMVSSPTEVRSVVERSSAMHESWEIFKENKLLGVGIGNYTLSSYFLDPSRPGWEYQPVHNIGFLMLAELGVIGFVLLLLMALVYIMFLYSTTQKSKKRKSWLTRNMGFVFTITGLSFIYLILGFFDHYLFSSYIGLIMTGIYWGLASRYISNHVHK